MIYTFVQSTYEDKPYLSQLRMNVLQDDFVRLELPRERVLQRFEDHFRPESIYLIKDQDVNTIGCIGMIEHEHSVELKNFYLEPALQGQGIGRTVFQHILSHYKDKEEISLKIFKGSRAKPLYQSFGFIVTEQNERVETMCLYQTVST